MRLIPTKAAPAATTTNFPSLKVLFNPVEQPRNVTSNKNGDTDGYDYKGKMISVAKRCRKKTFEASLFSIEDCRKYTS